VQDETDESLLTYIQFADEEPAVAGDATAEFCRRYQAALTRYCQRYCEKYPDLYLAGEDLANMTLWRALEKADTYVAADVLANQSTRTMAWLKAIARHQVIDFVRNPRRGSVKLVDSLESQSLGADDVADFLVRSDATIADADDIQLIVEAFHQLDERSRFVLVVTLEMQSGSPSGRYMVRGTAKELAAHLGITPEGVRQIRRRAIEKIESYIRKGRQDD
jgi:RNA polymerase sigma factor (sigma-70 family)